MGLTLEEKSPWQVDSGNLGWFFLARYERLLQIILLSKSCGPGVGKKGCGAFQLLSPDAAFHHLYLQRDCYYPMRDAKEIQPLVNPRFVGDLEDYWPPDPKGTLGIGVC